MSLDKTVLWQEANFRGQRKVLYRCLALKEKVENHLNRIKDDFYGSIECMDSRFNFFFASRFSELFYYQTVDPNSPLVAFEMETKATQVIKAFTDSINLFFELTPNHLGLTLSSNPDEILIYNKMLDKVTGSYKGERIHTAVMKTPLAFYFSQGTIVSEISLKKVNNENEEEKFELSQAFFWEVTEYKRAQVKLMAVSPNLLKLVWADDELTVKVIDMKTKDELKEFYSLHSSNFQFGSVLIPFLFSCNHNSPLG